MRCIICVHMGATLTFKVHEARWIVSEGTFSAKNCQFFTRTSAAGGPVGANECQMMRRGVLRDVVLVLGECGEVGRSSPWQAMERSSRQPGGIHLRLEAFGRWVLIIH